MTRFVARNSKLVSRTYAGESCGGVPINTKLLQLIADFGAQGIACGGVDVFALDRLHTASFIRKDKGRAFITSEGLAFLRRK